MGSDDKPLIWLSGTIQTPPFSWSARLEAGFLLRKLQQGESLSMPQSRTMTAIGARCHELRIKDENAEWRIMYRTDEDAVLILEVFQKKTRTTPKNVIEVCKRRLRKYDEDSSGEN